MGPPLALTDVGQAFQEHEVILTGASGFLGKVVLALILDRFPRLKHLHILLRPRGDVSAEERFLTETLPSPALKAVVEKRGRDFVRERITVWAGDIAQPDLGLGAATAERLSGRVGLIINCAGSVEFFPPLDVSFSSNVDGVEHVVALAKSLGSKLLHVSTCYVSGPADGLVEETEPIVGFYPRRRGPDDSSFNHVEEIRYARDRIRQIYESAYGSAEPSSAGKLGAADEAQRRKDVIQRLMALGRQRAEHWGWVNTYTYAKSLGEQIIAAEPGLDYAIVRPAIVESALEFPFPGWIEGGRTAAPLILMALGGLKDWPMRQDIPLEVVPVDLVAAAIVVVGGLLLDGRHEPVYQLGTADVNPILLGPLVNLLDAESRRRRAEAQNRDRNGAGHETGVEPRNGNGRAAGIPSFISGLVGARATGRVRFVTAEEARTRRESMQNRINRAQSLIGSVKGMLKAVRLPGTESLAGLSTALRTMGLQASFREQTLDQYLPFIRDNRYIFESENIRRAYTLISERERELLPWNPESIDWKAYWVENQIPGVERWVQPEAVKNWTFRI
ncbi:MAG TPA: SDR family oxidoreductase [Terriglobia bacterium]|nr:SDR family oxidoreductase [Terriglobia bacterium]